MIILRAKAILIFVCILFSAAVAQKDVLQNDKAQEILKKAKSAIGKKLDLTAVKTLTVNYEISTNHIFQKRSFESNAKVELNISEFDKVRASKSFEHFADGKPTNNEKQQFALKGDEFFFDTKVFSVSGDKIDFNANAEVDKNKLKKDFRYEVFHLFLPLLLDASWYFPINLTYVGTAESKDGKAEVLELASPNKTTYRLFFDAKTYLLLMMTETWTSKENKSFENKYFYSDYQEKSGLLAATKIIVDKNGKITEEKTIKDIKINPTFKPNFFDLK